MTYRLAKVNGKVIQVLRGSSVVYYDGDDRIEAPVALVEAGSFDEAVRKFSEENDGQGSRTGDASFIQRP